MNIREKKEAREDAFLSPFAQKSTASKGRRVYETPCEVRTCYERDRDRIIHAKAFRRLKHKTQVFIAPESDHLRTRLTHTLEVSQIARTIAVALDLNESLTEAIALGHDLGHTPFGHTGEHALNEVYPGFEHNLQSLRVVDELEGETGLNLTYEVRDGIKNHCSGYTPETLEGMIVHISDKIAYVNHDIQDAIESGVLSPGDLPADIIALLGETSAERINTMIVDIVNESAGKNAILRSPKIEDATMRLRDFLFQNVYINSPAKAEEPKAREVVLRLFEYYCAHFTEMPDEYVRRAEREGIERSVCDFVAGMTDNYATDVYKNLFIPKPWIT